MPQNRWKLGLRPRPHWGSLQRSPRPLAGFKGKDPRGRDGKGVGKGDEEGRRGGGREGEGAPGKGWGKGWEREREEGKEVGEEEGEKGGIAPWAQGG